MARHVDAPRKTASHRRKGPGGRCVGHDMFTYRCGLGQALACPPSEAESNGRPNISTGSSRRLMRPNVQTGQPSRHPQRRPRRLNTSEDSATAPPRQPHANISADPLLTHVAPIHWNHINLTGDYTWRQNKRVERGDFRPLRLADKSARLSVL
jgi:hypothetical protein